MKPKEIQIKKGVWANTFFLFVACFLIINGLLRLKDNLDFCYLILLGGLITIPKQGIQLDFLQNRFQEYVSIFGLKLGTWNTLTEFTCVSIIKVKRRFSIFQFAGNMPTNMEVNISKYSNFNVVLLSKKHRHKFVLKEFYSEAMQKNSRNRLSRIALFNMKNTILNYRLNLSSTVKNNGFDYIEKPKAKI